ncbi:MAG: mechanosensitive ion channel [Proteobacteria bacterium]|nr:mechanosensitive ion channel [Pseudomonadota bacterium]MBU1649154.1 mechanosensitive ion channel [Pseudomonadota bacterium]
MDAAYIPAQYLQLAKDWLLNNGIGLLMAIAIFILGRWLARWFATLGQKALLKGGVEYTLAQFLNKLIYYALLTTVIVAAADQLGIKTTSFIAILGAAGLAIALALKDSLANFASGLMLIMFRPFKVGDVITASGVTGTVRDIDIFSTIILTGDNQKIIVPNSGITSGIITNINAESTRRIDLTIGIGYQDDSNQAKEVLFELLQADKRILTDPAPQIAIAELAESSIQIVVRPWVQTSDYWDVRFDLTEKIKISFDEKGISFPYPQRDVHIYQTNRQDSTEH